MKNKLNLLISLIVFASLLCCLLYLKFQSSKSTEEVYYEVLNTSSCGFEFENVVFSDCVLIPFIKKELKHDGSFASLPLDDTLLSRLSLRKLLGREVASSIKKFGVVNRKYGGGFSTSGDSVFYCGQIDLSNNYKSFLFLIKTKEINTPDEYEFVLNFINREMFLINMCNDTITSVSSVYSYSSLDDNELYSYLSLEDNHFCYCAEVLSTDNILLPEMENYNNVKKYYFMFDRYGRIVKN